MILDKEKYFNFVNNHKLLTFYQKKELINYHNLKNTSYIESNSNNQFNFYVTDIIKNNNIEEMCRIKLLLNHFVNNDLTEKIKYIFK